jgi:hypothetical protein
MAQRNVSAPITTLGLGTATLETAMRGYEKSVYHAVKSVDDYLPQIFEVSKFDPKKIKKMVWSGGRKAGVWNDNTIIGNTDIAKLGEVTAEVFWYALGSEVSFQAKEHDLYNVLEMEGQQVGIGLAETKQEIGFDWLTGNLPSGGGSWNTDAVDGTDLFSTSHPYDTRADLYTVAGTYNQSNYITGGINIDTLISALKALTIVKDAMGRPMNCNPVKLICDQYYATDWRNIINVAMNLKSGTANNDRNPFKDWAGVTAEDFVQGVPGHYLAASGATSTRWFLKGTKAKLFMNPYMPITFLPTIMTDAHAVKKDAAFCMGFWAEDWRGMVAGPGV